MTLLDILTVTTGGVRFALALLGVMAWITLRHMPPAEGREELYHRRTITLFVLACVIFSPARAVYLLGHPLPAPIGRILDLTATGLSCTALIYFIASRAVQRGVPMFRVRRAMAANACVVLGFILVAWTVR